MAIPAATKLPYFRDTQELPGPLPTYTEIQHAPKSDLSPRRSGMGDGGGICVIRDTFLVKFGFNVSENEGDALLFLEKHSSIPVPRLFAMYHGPPPSKHLYLVMEYIHGVNLDSLWSCLSAQDKASIAMQLSRFFTEMRSISVPQNFIGGVCGGSMPDPIFRTEKPNAQINGPFQSTVEVAAALALASQENSKESQYRTWVPDFFSRHLTAILSNEKVTFTHGDFHLRHVLVERRRKQHITEEDISQSTMIGEQWEYTVNGIVDWETAGWYPAYWEYVSAMTRFHEENDWPETLDTIMQPYPQEYPVFSLVLQDLQFLY